MDINYLNSSYCLGNASECIAQIKKQIQQLKPAHTVIITDDNVCALHARALAVSLDIQPEFILSMPAGDQHKNRETKAALEDRLLARGCLRKTLVIAVGGGVVCDMAGFIAATYCRGVPVIYYPTTLLAMVDAAIGGKTGINTPLGKNLIGVIRQPLLTVANQETLNTLATVNIIEGMAESLKHGLIADAEYFHYLLAHGEAIIAQQPEALVQCIARSVEIKSTIVEADFMEHNLRVILNYGHTIAHALEQVSDYQVPHGIAVLFGLLVENKLNQLDTSLQTQLMDFVLSLRLDWQYYLPTDATRVMLQAMMRDKKNQSSAPAFVSLPSLGCAHPELNYYQPELIEHALIDTINQVVAN